MPRVMDWHGRGMKDHIYYGFLLLSTRLLSLVGNIIAPLNSHIQAHSMVTATAASHNSTLELTAISNCLQTCLGSNGCTTEPGQSVQRMHMEICRSPTLTDKLSIRMSEDMLSSISKLLHTCSQ